MRTGRENTLSQHDDTVAAFSIRDPGQPTVPCTPILKQQSKTSHARRYRHQESNAFMNRDWPSSPATPAESVPNLSRRCWPTPRRTDWPTCWLPGMPACSRWVVRRRRTRLLFDSTRRCSDIPHLHPQNPRDFSLRTMHTTAPAPSRNISYADHHDPRLKGHRTQLFVAVPLVEARTQEACGAQRRNPRRSLRQGSVR